MGALALHLLVELTMLREKDGEARMTVHDLAEKLHASAHTLQKVAHRLIALERIEGTRGAKGGLRLTADPGAITLLDIIEDMEGKVNYNGCLFAKRVCLPEARCVVSRLTGQMEKTVRGYFENTTLAELRDIALRPE
jgi:Rrf2 family protein